MVGEYLKSICIFENTEGWVLEGGRREAAKLSDVADAATLLEEITNKLRAVGVIQHVRSKSNGLREVSK